MKQMPPPLVRLRVCANILLVLSYVIILATDAVQSQQQGVGGAVDFDLVESLALHVEEERAKAAADAGARPGAIEWTPKMDRFRMVLVDHHPHRGRRLKEEESETCIEHFDTLQREVRLSILGHHFSDYAESAAMARVGEDTNMMTIPDAVHKAVKAWENSRFQGGTPMKSWAKKHVHNGELKLLAHECVGTILRSDKWNRIWSVLTSLEKDFIVMQWNGLTEHYNL